VIGVGGTVLGVAAAVALSPLTPIGVARRAELNLGVVADWPILAAGGLAIVVLVGVGAALAAWRAAGTRDNARGVIDPAGPGRPSRVAAALAGAGVSPMAVIGCGSPWSLAGEGPPCPCGPPWPGPWRPSAP
jgi:putative ABC transport system permease protein